MKFAVANIPRSTSIQIASIGDMLIHSRIYNDAETADGYDFMPMLEQVEPYLSNLDIATANQETMIGGEAIGLSTYPRFNSPHEVGDALKKIGIEVITLTNNHSLDRGEESVYAAVDYWDQIEVKYTNSYRDQFDRDQI